MAEYDSKGVPNENCIIWTIDFLIACGDKDATEDNSDITGNASAGETLYASDCSGCHGSTADGGSAPGLKGVEVEVFTDVLANGIGYMPAFPNYTEQDIADVVAYIDSL